jgi:anti-sigma factor RsiW
MNCEQAKSLLDTYIDRELGPDEMAQIEQHLETCPECKTALARLRQFREFFIANGPRYTPPPDLKVKVLARLEILKRRDAMAWLRKPWVYAGILLAVCSFLGWCRVSVDQEKAIAAQAVSNYARAAVLEHLCDVVSPDPAIVKPWLTAKLDFSPPVVLPGLGFQMRGGRLDVIENRKVAGLVYKRDKDLVTVFVWPADGKRLSQRTWSLDGKQVSAFNHADLNFVAVSNMSGPGLSELVDRLRNEIK